MTINALKPQKTIARELITNETDYVLSLEGSHSKINDALKVYTGHITEGFASVDARHTEWSSVLSLYGPNSSSGFTDFETQSNERET